MDRRIRKVLRVLTLLGLAGLLFALPVLAAYSATIRVIETSNTSYTELPIIASINNDYLATEGYITATGLDTRVEAGGVAVPHLVADDKLLFVDGISANTTANFQYTTGNIPLSDFYVITGYNGYVTIPDDPTIECSDNFSISQSGWVSTSSGASKNLVFKDGSFRTYIGATDNITSELTSWSVPGAAINQTSYNAGDDNVADTGVQWLGQTWTGANDFQITHITMLVYRTGNPGIMTVYITPVDGAGKPVTTTTLATGTIDADTFGVAPGWETINLSSCIMEGGTQYAVWFKVAAGLDPANKVHWRWDSTGPTYGGGVYCWSADETTWTLVPAGDFMFEIWGKTATLTVLQVSANGVSSAVRSVATSANTTAFWIEIDGSMAETVALGGASVWDSGSNWVIMQNNVISYMDYMTIDVAGVEQLRYQPAAIISGTTLVDETGANDGTITWGANPAGLAVTVGSLVSEDQPVPSIVGAEETVSDIAPVITQPANYLTGRDMSGHPLYAIVKPLADLSGFNESWIWIGAATLIVFSAMIWALAKLRNQMIAGIAGFALIALFYSMGIYPFWVVIVYALVAVAIVVFERVQTV